MVTYFSIETPTAYIYLVQFRLLHQQKQKYLSQLTQSIEHRPSVIHLLRLQCKKSAGVQQPPLEEEVHTK